MAQLRVKNPWSVPGGVEAQRADLWLLDLSPIISGLTSQLTGKVNFNLPDPTDNFYFASAITFPELRINPTMARKDSRPLNLPEFDEAVSAVRVTFLADAAADVVHTSKIYSLLELWRLAVRAGRSPVLSSTQAPLFPLNRTYKFDLQCQLLKGVDLTALTSGNTRGLVTQSGGNFESVTAADQVLFNGQTMDPSTSITLVRTWLSGIQVGDLSYHGGTNSPALIYATLYPEDINGNLLLSLPRSTSEELF